MTDMKGHKTPTEGPAVGVLSGEAEGVSRNWEAKCIYASLTPFLFIVFFLVVTLAPVLSLSKDAYAAPVGSSDFQVLPQTGQATCYDASGSVVACAGTGQDGDKKTGKAWPDPRFTDNGNGTVTDNLTGLLWLKNANCFGSQTWAAAVSSAGGLANGACSLTDGSTAGQWRLPNISELESLVDLSKNNPALPAGHPFSNAQSYYYWSSSTYAGSTSYAWYVSMLNGYVYYSNKTYSNYVWPVRGAGQ